MQFQAAKGGGGAGEFWLSFPMAVVGGTAYFVDPSDGGLGNKKSAAATAISMPSPNPATFNGFNILGGLVCTPGAGATQGGDGGGPGGSLRGGSGGAHNPIGGALEAPCACGGAGGGIGGVFHGGQQIGQYLTPDGGAATFGGSGGSGVFGQGGIGANVIDVPATPASGYGGGGAGGVQGGSGGLADIGGSGFGGIVMIFWVAHG